MPGPIEDRSRGYATTINYLLRITTFPMSYSSIIVRRPVTACRSIEFPLPGKILRTWSNFGWLWRTFAEKEGNLPTTCFSRTSSRYPDFDSQSCPSAERTIGVHEAQCPGSPLLRLQSGDPQRLEPPPSLLSRAELDNLRQCSVRSIALDQPDDRATAAADRGIPELLLVDTWLQNWLPLTAYELCQ